MAHAAAAGDNESMAGRKLFTTVLVALAMLAIAPAAQARVLFEPPSSRICEGEDIVVGVKAEWLTLNRSYTVRIYNPRGRLAGKASGTAPRASWRWLRF